ncbi:hypothetical protein LR48_Vigan09g096400 [Vigna angularis]|uniref:Serine-threonine/tyrosine-protein kinase catalytic domain-containing protein n=1 Tax=Phaseolus angularis TaxID=3914 RepID=A0A0L9VB67_PHAAN|nr:hypothetical protein LR48_Vigan09g096400 [Vigna angularis]
MWLLLQMYPTLRYQISGDGERHDQTPPPVAASHASSSNEVDEITNSVHGKLTDKSDVYAFGVVLLKLLVGKKLLVVLL